MEVVSEVRRSAVFREILPSSLPARALYSHSQRKKGLGTYIYKRDLIHSHSTLEISHPICMLFLYSLSLSGVAGQERVTAGCERERTRATATRRANAAPLLHTRTPSICRNDNARRLDARTHIWTTPLKNNNTQ